MGKPFPIEIEERVDGLASSLADIAINVKSFGAKGDKVTDDTEALRQAMRAYDPYDYDTTYQTQGKETGRVIYLPPGDYYITDKLYLRKGDVLRGSGYTTTRIFTNQPIGTMLKLGWGLINGVETKDSGGLVPVVENITFVETVGGIKAIDIDGISGAIIKNCWFFADTCVKTLNSNDIMILNCVADNECAHLAILEGSGDEYNTSQSILIDGCNIFKTRYAGVKIDGVADVKITNTFFNFCKNYSIYTGTKNNYRITVDNCTFKTSKTASYYDANQQHVRITSPSKEFKITNCQFSFSRNADIHTTSELIIENCTFYKSARKAIEVVGGNGVRVKNCEFTSTANYPITSTPKIIVDNCHFYNPFTDGLPTNDYDKGCILINNIAGSYSRITNCTTDSTVVAVLSVKVATDVFTANNKSEWTNDVYFYTDAFYTSINQRAEHPVARYKLIIGYKGKNKICEHTTVPTVTEGYSNGDVIIIRTPTPGGYEKYIMIGGVWKGSGLIQS